MEKNIAEQNRIHFWTRFLFYFWLYTILVILWGAWVRISHSGDGCGDHWPTCQGDLIPDFNEKKTWIEYAHRLMSGSFGIIVIFIFFQLRKFSLSTRLQKINGLLVALMISEALIGALLVKGRLVTENDSILRLFVMAFHQLNSFLLTGVTYLIYLNLKAGPHVPLQIRNKKYLLLFLLLPLTGAIASLSTTLFPTISLWQGLMEDFSSNHHLFIRLRILHPLIALGIGSFFIGWFYFKSEIKISFYFLTAVFIGIITLLSLSPIYLKILHLAMAHFVWSMLVQIFVSFPDSSKR